MVTGELPSEIAPPIADADDLHRDISFHEAGPFGLEAGMVIRDEVDGDHETVRSVTSRAFDGHPHSSGGEAALVDMLRTAGALSLSLVSEDEGGIVGHIAFSPVEIGDGSIGGWHGLGPLSVRPDKQGRGIGSELVAEGLRRLQDKGAKGCVLVGEPGYYSRFGFEPCPRLVFAGVPPEYFLCRWIDGPLPQGKVRYHQAFAAV
jgi:putative acetyltransferase